jgi:IS30 family transposase
MRSIHQRPAAAQSRRQAGHWEGDLIIGKDQQSAIGTLVERQTRLVRQLHLPQRDGDTLHDALKDRLGELPPDVVRSITWDQGTEMARLPHYRSQALLLRDAAQGVSGDHGGVVLTDLSTAEP